MTQHARLDPITIPFVDVAAQRRRLGARIDEAIARVTAHCQFIMGPEVFACEADLAAFCGVRHAITVSNGTDALVLALMAHGIGPGDAVFCPSFTFCATGESIALTGATPVFVDVDERSFNIDPESLERAIAAAGDLRPRAVMPVDLFGLPADYDAIGAIAARHGLTVIADAAQSFGATFRDRKVGTLAPVTTTSFFPAKPLGCYGDGGAVFTDDDTLAAALRSLRNHGEGSHRYDNVRIGLNGRMDTIQCAVLIEKLKIFPDEIAARNRVARRYGDALADVATVPVVPNDSHSVWAQYTIRIGSGRRDAVQQALRAEGIPSVIYYPTPTHRQTAYRGFPAAAGGLPVTERLSADVLSLPMHAYLDEPTQDRIIAAVRRALGA
ncbi:MAG: DegT/DnrJ/EryC1/StrS family aminotransferase [Xanthobacteraceae bacterium]|nr:DegT/DnrJ/EryC1/StrS family aminotransferase [Xanthobacteraceae bacterium]